MRSAGLALVHACDSSFAWDHFLDFLSLNRNLCLQVKPLERHLIKFLKHLGGENRNKISVLNPDELKLVFFFFLCQLWHRFPEVDRVYTVGTACLKLPQKDSKVSGDLALPRENDWNESHKDLMWCDHRSHEFSIID